MLPLRLAQTLVLLACVAVIGTALFAQYVGGLQPCELCLLERWPYYTAIVVAVLAVASGNARVIRVTLALSALIFLVGAGLGLYHVAVEQHWIEGPTACTGVLGRPSSPEALLRALEARQPVQCDVVQWSFFGISLAGFNVIASLALTGFSILALTRQRSRGYR